MRAFLVAFLIVGFFPLDALARANRPNRVFPKKKYKTVGRCLLPDGKTWIRGCK